MTPISKIIFRYLTDADFFNINKPSGTEEGGGGQSYIDFPMQDISITEWKNFFRGVVGVEEYESTGRPAWKVPIHSIGLPSDLKQDVKIYQRRASSVSIASQKLHSQSGNRIHAWHPTYGFPVPEFPENRQQLPNGLAIYLVRTINCELWAGWYCKEAMERLPTNNPDVINYLFDIFGKTREQGDAGLLICGENHLALNESEPSNAIVALEALEPVVTAISSKSKSEVLEAYTEWEIKGKPKSVAVDKKEFYQLNKTEDELAESLFSEDSNYLQSGDEQFVAAKTKVRKRNQRAVKDLKDLYGHTCQISGTEYLFRKKDGTFYTEAHHLIPLGDGGADNPLNMVILSPLIHRMLHYADVEPIELSKIDKKPDGSAELNIQINKKKYTIRWHNLHYEYIVKHTQPPD